jgi:hypothetical protein
MSRSLFVAAFDSQCAADCGRRIVVGDVIVRLGESYAHQSCPDSPDEVADRAALAQPRCGRCELNHPGEC